jgi:hypothetical protein
MGKLSNDYHINKVVKQLQEGDSAFIFLVAVFSWLLPPDSEIFHRLNY